MFQLLFTTGASFLLGGMNRLEQHFNATLAPLGVADVEEDKEADEEEKQPRFTMISASVVIMFTLLS